MRKFKKYCTIFHIFSKSPQNVTYTCDGIFDATAPMRNKLLIFADEIVNFFDWQREFRQCQEGRQIGGVKRGQNRDENPPR